MNVVLACDMRNGLVMLPRFHDPLLAWRVLACLSHPAHAEVADLDGNVDVVATSFLPAVNFPARKEPGADAVVVLEQTARGKFARHALASGDCGHVSCALGDL